MTSIRKRRRQIAKLAAERARCWRINFSPCVKFDSRVLQLNIHGDRLIVTTAKGAFALSRRDMERRKPADFSRRAP